ncbi:bifunctional DNA primase/polymerase [Pseudonocardia alni]|uniref:bifunctional DNA primase/polymerase n=1 Tax=Pseudonocardia alni TaxID=33907 RepID=UPI0033219A7B
MQHPRNHSPQRGEMPRPHAGATRPATETVASPWPPGPLASAALDAAARGWPVFPVRPWAKIPAVTDWENAATTDPDRITAWWSARAWNIGLCTGRAGLLVVDLDVGCGDQPPPQWAGARDGADVLDRLAAAAGQPPPTGTYTVLTPSVIYGCRFGSQHCQRRATCVARGLVASAVSAGLQRRAAPAASSRVGELR